MVNSVSIHDVDTSKNSLIIPVIFNVMLNWKYLSGHDGCGIVNILNIISFLCVCSPSKNYNLNLHVKIFLLFRVEEDGIPIGPLDLA